MEIFVLIVGSIVAMIIAFSSFLKTAKNEPLKSKIDSFFKKSNRSIINLFSNDTKEILNSFASLSFKLFGWGMILYFLILLLLPTFALPYIQTFLSASIITLFLINFSINWILHHKKAFIDNLKNIYLILISVAPTIIYILNPYLGNKETDKLFHPLFDLLNSHLTLFQIIWMASTFLIFYVGAFLIAAPIFILAFAVAGIFRKLILSIYKYWNSEDILKPIAYLLYFVILMISTIITIIKN